MASPVLELDDPGVADPANVVAAFAPRSAGGSVTEAKIVVIDDEPINVRIIAAFLRREGLCRVATFMDPRAALDAVRRDAPDLILTDLRMPGLDGLDLIREFRADPRLALLPVIVLSASSDAETRAEALRLGATDFLNKPFDPVELSPRVRNALLLKAHQDDLRRRAETLESLVRVRTAELEASRREVIHCLARAAEFRDNETGRHVIRVGRYAAIIAARIGCGRAECELIELAAPLHDIGKIGIPDSVLLKPGTLTADEYEQMKRHAAMGEQIVRPLGDDAWATPPTSAGTTVPATASPILVLASRIAGSHHERWDGTGYPHGLAGEAIPLEGRITAVADVFDALSNARPYKPAFPLAKCLAILDEGRGSHFDPAVLDAFHAGLDEILAVRESLAD
jgi:putative two-component system response regulator